MTARQCPVDGCPTPVQPFFDGDPFRGLFKHLRVVHKLSPREANAARDHDCRQGRLTTLAGLLAGGEEPPST